MLLGDDGCRRTWTICAAIIAFVGFDVAVAHPNDPPGPAGIEEQIAKTAKLRALAGRRPGLRRMPGFRFLHARPNPDDEQRVLKGQAANFHEQLKQRGDKLDQGLNDVVHEIDLSQTQAEIAQILPARDEYIVTTSEFDVIKSRLNRIENRNKLDDKKKDADKPTLRTRTEQQQDKANKEPAQTGDDSDPDRPTLKKRTDDGQ